MRSPHDISNSGHNDIDSICKQTVNEYEECPVVSFANTVADPWTVVVHAVNTTITY